MYMLWIGLLSIAFLLLPLVLAVIALAQIGTFSQRLRQIERRLTDKSPDRPTGGVNAAKGPTPIAADRKPKSSPAIAPVVAKPVTLGWPGKSAVPLGAKPQPETDPSRPDAPAPDRTRNGLELFVGRRLIGMLGIVMLLLAVTFGLTYTVRRFDLLPALRLGGSTVLGFALLAAGIRLHRHPRMHGLARTVMGGSAGVLYLTVFAAHAFDPVLNPLQAGTGLVAVALLTLCLAAVYHSQAIAIIGTAGAFCMPLVISLESPLDDFLLLYVLVLNLPSIVLGYRRNWQGLTNGAFAASALIGMFWMTGRFTVDPDIHLFRAAWFWIGFGAAYQALAFLKQRHRTTRVSDLARQALLTVLLGAVGWWILNRAGFPDSRPLLFVVLALLYVALAATTWPRHASSGSACLLWIGGAAGYLAIAVPLRFEGAPVALLWGVEGVVLIAAGLQVPSRRIRQSGAGCLVLGSLWALAVDVPTPVLRQSLALNAWFATVLGMAGLVLLVAGLYGYRDFRDRQVRTTPSRAAGLAWVVVTAGFAINAVAFFKTAETAGLAIAALWVLASLDWAWAGTLFQGLRPLERASPVAGAALLLPAGITLPLLLRPASGPPTPWHFCLWGLLALALVLAAPAPKRMRPVGAGLAIAGLVRALWLTPLRFPAPDAWLFNAHVGTALGATCLLAALLWQPSRERRHSGPLSPAARHLIGLTAATGLLMAIGMALSTLSPAFGLSRDWSGAAVTLWLTAFAFTACLCGILRQSGILRVYGLTLLALAVLRILRALWSLEDPARILALFGAGLLLLLLSYRYHRWTSA